MSSYNVNLAKGLVPNAAERKKRYLIMVLYFGVCGLLLIEGGFRAIADEVAAESARLKTDQLNQAFLSSHPKGGAMKSYATQLNAKVGLNKRHILALEKEFPAEQPLVQALFCLMQDIPPTGKLLSFKSDMTRSEIVFSCELIQVENQSLTPTQLLQCWRDNQPLFQYAESVVLLDLEENLFVKGRPAVKLNCRLKLKPVKG